MAMRSPMGDSPIYFVLPCISNGNWSENIFYVCTPIVAIESRNRFGKQ